MQSGVFSSAITDHKLIFACATVKTTKKNPCFIKKIRDHSEMNVQNPKNYCQEFNANSMPKCFRDKSERRVFQRNGQSCFV